MPRSPVPLSGCARKGLLSSGPEPPTTTWRRPRHELRRRLTTGSTPGATDPRGDRRARLHHPQADRLVLRAARGHGDRVPPHRERRRPARRPARGPVAQPRPEDRPARRDHAAGGAAAAALPVLAARGERVRPALRRLRPRQEPLRPGRLVDPVPRDELDPAAGAHRRPGRHRHRHRGRHRLGTAAVQRLRLLDHLRRLRLLLAPVVLGRGAAQAVRRDHLQRLAARPRDPAAGDPRGRGRQRRDLDGRPGRHPAAPADHLRLGRGGDGSRALLPVGHALVQDPLARHRAHRGVRDRHRLPGHRPGVRPGQAQGPLRGPGLRRRRHHLVLRHPAGAASTRAGGTW